MTLKNGFQFSGPEDSLVGHLDRVEFLFLVLPDTQDLGFLGALPALRRLMLVGLDSGAALGSLPTIRLQLEQLMVGGDAKQVVDLSFLRGLDRLEDFQFLGCKSLKDASIVARLPRLAALSLYCDGAEAALQSAASRNLRRLGVVTDADLAEIVAQHPQLEAIEIRSEKPPGDLAPLKSLSRLQALTLFDEPLTSPRVATLSQLNGLRILLLGISVGKSDAPSKSVAALQQALPRCVVSQVGVCLGSGWMLWLVPVVIVSAWLGARRRRRRATA